MIFLSCLFELFFLPRRFAGQSRIVIGRGCLATNLKLALLPAQLKHYHSHLLQNTRTRGTHPPACHPSSDTTGLSVEEYSTHGELQCGTRRRCLSWLCWRENGRTWSGWFVFWRAAVHLLCFRDGVKCIGDVFVSHETQRSSEEHPRPPPTCTLTLTGDRSESAPPTALKGRFLLWACAVCIYREFPLKIRVSWYQV